MTQQTGTPGAAKFAGLHGRQTSAAGIAEHTQSIASAPPGCLPVLARRWSSHSTAPQHTTWHGTHAPFPSHHWSMAGLSWAHGCWTAGYQCWKGTEMGAWVNWQAGKVALAGTSFGLRWESSCFPPHCCPPWLAATGLPRRRISWFQMGWEQSWVGTDRVTALALGAGWHRTPASPCLSQPHFLVYPWAGSEGEQWQVWGLLRGSPTRDRLLVASCAPGSTSGSVPSLQPWHISSYHTASPGQGDFDCLRAITPLAMPQAGHFPPRSCR